MASRATGFAKKPPAAVVEAPRVEIRAPMAPADEIEPPDPIPIDLAPLVAPYRKRGRVTVRIERLPHRARLSHGQNNGDRSWSVALDELDGLAYLPANSADEIQTLAIRIIRVDGGDAATLAVLDYPLPSDAASEPVKAAARGNVALSDNKELRSLRHELSSATATLEARTAELAELRRTASGVAPKQSIEAELAAMRASWEAEIEERLVLATKAAAADLEKNRAAWRVEEDIRLVKAEKRAREGARQDVGDMLAKAEREWKAAEAQRLGEAHAKWQQQSAKALATATAEFEKVKARSEPARARNDEAELRRLRDEFAQAKTSLAERDSELARVRAEAELLRGDRTKLGRQNDELTKAKTTLVERERELAQARRDADTLRSDNAKLGRLNDDLTKSKTILADREIESARARAETDALRGELEKAKGTLATRDDELRQSRSNAERARDEAKKLRNDGAELERVNDELASAKASLVVRDAELARMRVSQEESRIRWQHEAEASLSEAQRRWNDGEAERFAAEETRWRKHADMAIAEVVARMDRAEARALAEIENNRNSDGEIRRLADDLVQTKATLTERENELVRARLGHEQARERWMQETEAALSKAQEAWKAGEAERLAESESESLERSKLALTNMTAQVKKLEAALAESRAQIEVLRHRGDSADFRQLRKEFASLQATLASRESELMQLRSDQEIDRERWTSEARNALQRADRNWRAEEAEETEEAERKHRAQTARRLLRDAIIAASFAGLAMLGYYRLAPMLTNSAPDLFQPLLDRAGIAMEQPAPAQRAPTQPSPPPVQHSLVVARGVNLRAGPSTTAAVVAALPRDAEVTALESRGNWVRIRFANGKDKPLEGWAFKSFLQDSAKSLSSASK